LRFGLAFAPGFALLVWFLAARAGSGRLEGGWHMWTVNQFGGRFVDAFAMFWEFRPWVTMESWWLQGGALLNAGVSVAAAATMAIAGYWWLRGRGRTSVFAAAGACAASAAAGGFSFAGWVGPGERFFYPSLWLFLCLIAGSTGPVRPTLVRTLVAAAAAALVVQHLYLHTYAPRASAGLQQMYDELKAAPTPAEFCETYERYVRRAEPARGRSGIAKFVSSYDGASRMPYYIFLEERRHVPIFLEGIFRYAGGRDPMWPCRKREDERAGTGVAAPAEPRYPAM
jgi:hypothetical protein